MASHSGDEPHAPSPASPMWPHKEQGSLMGRSCSVGVQNRGLGISAALWTRLDGGNSTPSAREHHALGRSRSGEEGPQRHRACPGPAPPPALWQGRRHRGSRSGLPLMFERGHWAHGVCLIRAPGPALSREGSRSGQNTVPSGHMSGMCEYRAGRQGNANLSWGKQSPFGFDVRASTRFGQLRARLKPRRQPEGSQKGPRTRYPCVRLLGYSEQWAGQLVSGPKAGEEGAQGPLVTGLRPWQPREDHWVACASVSHLRTGISRAPTSWVWYCFHGAVGTTRGAPFPVPGLHKRSMDGHFLLER